MKVNKTIIWASTAIVAVVAIVLVVLTVKKNKATPKIIDDATTTPEEQAAMDELKKLKNFPLKKGSKNEYVLNIQKKLGVKPETSLFGDITEATVFKKYATKTIEYPLYNQIMNN